MGKEDGKLSLAFYRSFIKDYRGFVSGLIAKHGDTFKLKGPFYDLHIVSNPAHVEHILFSKDSNYIRPPNKVVELILRDTSISLSEEDILWRKERFGVINPFLTEAFVKNYLEGAIEKTAEYLDTWEDNVVKKKPLELNAEFLSLTLGVLTKSLLANTPLDLKYASDIVREAHYLLVCYEKSITKLPWKFPTSMSRRTKAVKEALHNVSTGIAEHCLAHKESVGNILASIAKNSTAKGKELTAHLCRRATALLLAGFDTVGTDLTWLFTYLSLYPAVAQKIHEEVKKVIGDRRLTPDDTNNLPYTRAVIFETLRLSALPFLPRLALDRDTIGDHVINKNDRILIPVFYMHRVPQYWSNPEGFDPTRFLSPLDNRYRYLFLPFSAGPRGCMGKNFAVMSMTVIVAMVMQKYRLDLTPNQNINPDFHFLDPRLHVDVSMTVNRAV